MRRLTTIGFWFGILFACIPLFMYGYGVAKQKALVRVWQGQHDHPSTFHYPNADGSDGDALMHLMIPKLKIDAMVVGDVTDAALAQGPGHFPSSALPGEVGNCTILAHRNVWGNWFSRLDELNAGDKVIVETATQKFVYRVTEHKVVEPTEISVLEPHGKKRELTLITCTLPATHRLIVESVLDHQAAA
ncbi:MAG: class E sortase [Armatimonadota bacterium]|nr:class E sortase [Armatimonadota bacterium]